MEELKSDKLFNPKELTKLTKVPAIIIAAKDCSNFIKQFRHVSLNLPKKPCIATIPELDKNQKLFLLREELLGKDQQEWDSDLAKLIKEKQLKVIEYNVITDYQDLTMQEALAQLLPSNVLIPSSFEIVGTIAHLNLRNKEQLEYKKIIGQVLLDKNNGIRTVVNKTQALTNEFRTPELEYLAGVESFETEVKEGNCIFELDYSKVYWNSRLQGDRDKLSQIIKPGEVLCDMFGGIGPLSLRVAKQVQQQKQNKIYQGSLALCNDLNPECYKYLTRNVKRNKLEGKVLCYNQDARGFLKYVVSKKGMLTLPEQFRHFDHIYMNLPGNAIEFLDVFQGFLYDADLDIWKGKLPIIHVYTFQEQEEDKEKQKEILIDKVIKYIGEQFDRNDLIEIRDVRDISSLKSMYRITFKLSEKVANDFSKIVSQNDGDNEQPVFQTQKLKVE